MSEGARDEVFAFLDKLAADVSIPHRARFPRPDELILCAREVLWHIEHDRVLGIEPSEVDKRVIDAMFAAKKGELSRFVWSFTALTTIVNEYRFMDEGVERVHALARMNPPAPADGTTPKGN